MVFPTSRRLVQRGTDALPCSHGPIAQLAEQRTFNPWVGGSIPPGPTIMMCRGIVDNQLAVSRSFTISPTLPRMP